MDHIAHLRKQFKSINTHDYIITLIKRRRRNIINLINRICLISWMYFLLFRYYLPLEKGGALNSNKLETSQPRMLVSSLVEIGSVDLENRSKIGKVYKWTDRRTYRQTDRQSTEDRRLEKLTWAFISGELKTSGKTTKVTLKVHDMERER